MFAFEQMFPFTGNDVELLARIVDTDNPIQPITHLGGWVDGRAYDPTGIAILEGGTLHPAISMTATTGGNVSEIWFTPYTPTNPILLIDGMRPTFHRNGNLVNAATRLPLI